MTLQWLCVMIVMTAGKFDARHCFTFDELEAGANMLATSITLISLQKPAKHDRRCMHIDMMRAAAQHMSDLSWTMHVRLRNTCTYRSCFKEPLTLWQRLICTVYTDAMLYMLTKCIHHRIMSARFCLKRAHLSLSNLTLSRNSSSLCAWPVLSTLKIK